MLRSDEAQDVTEAGNRNLQGVLEVFVNLHNGRLIAAAVAVIGC
jgi:hypothetical protein